MQGRQVYNRWTQFIETPRKKWVSFSDGIVVALAEEEEMKIQREELRKEITALSQRN